MPDAVNRFQGAVKDSFITGLQIIQEKLCELFGKVTLAEQRLH